MVSAESTWLFLFMETIIREAQESDVPVIISLLKDFAAFENLSELLTISEDDLHNAMFGEGSFVEGLVCEIDGETGGFAIFYPRFSSFRGQCGYYLEDIYIGDEFRGRGLGEKLLKEIARKVGDLIHLQRAPAHFSGKIRILRKTAVFFLLDLEKKI